MSPSASAREPYVHGLRPAQRALAGPQWPTCANPNGCPAFEQGSLAPMQQKAIAAIRRSTRSTSSGTSRSSPANFGAKYHHPDTGDPEAGMSFHVYCLADALAGLPVTIPSSPT